MILKEHHSFIAIKICAIEKKYWKYEQLKINSTGDFFPAA
jgi:hypothetical protein